MNLNQTRRKLARFLYDYDDKAYNNAIRNPRDELIGTPLVNGAAVGMALFLIGAFVLISPFMLVIAAVVFALWLVGALATSLYYWFIKKEKKTREVFA